MFLAQAGAAANENLGCSCSQGGRGLWSCGAGCLLQPQLLPRWHLLNPSQQVYNTWVARSVTREGWASSSSSCSVPGVPDGWPSLGAQELGVQTRQDVPTPDPPRLGGEGLGMGSQLSLHALCVWGLNLSQPAGAHGRRQALPHSETAVAGSASGQGGAGQSPFCFLFLPMPLLETGRGLPRGDMK